jgi:hypothetical protein
MSQSAITTAPTGSTVNPTLNQLQTGVVAAAQASNAAAAGGTTSGALAGPATFNTLATPEAGASPTSQTSGGFGQGVNPQQPGAGKALQSGSNDAVANDVSAALTAVGASSNNLTSSSGSGGINSIPGVGTSSAAPNGTPATQPLTPQSLNTANDNYGHLNAYLSVYA